MEDNKKQKFSIDPDDVMFLVAIISIAIGSFCISHIHGFIVTGGVLFGWLVLDNALKVMFTKK